MKITHVNRTFGGQCEAVKVGDKVKVKYQYGQTFIFSLEEFEKDFKPVKVSLLDRILLCLGLL